MRKHRSPKHGSVSKLESLSQVTQLTGLTVVMTSKRHSEAWRDSSSRQRDACHGMALSTLPWGGRVTGPDGRVDVMGHPLWRNDRVPCMTRSTFLGEQHEKCPFQLSIINSSVPRSNVNVLQIGCMGTGRWPFQTCQRERGATIG